MGGDLEYVIVGYTIFRIGYRYVKLSFSLVMEHILGSGAPECIFKK